MKVTDFIPFLTDLFVRLFKPTPKFFQVLQVISTILLVISGLPGFLESNGVTLPEPIHSIANKAIGVISIVIIFIAQLTVVDRNNLKMDK
jgi:hypothetical protein